jgi:hypothetical protein
LKTARANTSQDSISKKKKSQKSSDGMTQGVKPQTTKKKKEKKS